MAWGVVLFVGFVLADLVFYLLYLFWVGVLVGAIVVLVCFVG